MLFSQIITGLTYRDKQLQSHWLRVTNGPNFCTSYDCGRKLEYPERTHTGTGRTYKLHTAKPCSGLTPVLLAVDQQQL